MTLEEEETGNLTLLEKQNLAPQMNQSSNPELEMDAEKILEEEDWMDEEDEFDVENDDLLDEEELQKLMTEDQSEKEAKILAPVGLAGGVASTKSAMMGVSGLPRAEQQPPTGRPPRSRTGSPNGSSPSTQRKKKNPSSPSVTGLSLKKRNMLLGMGSPKDRQKKFGPSLAQLEDRGVIEPRTSLCPPMPPGQKKIKASSKVSTKSSGKITGINSTKVGSSKPPKIPE